MITQFMLGAFAVFCFMENLSGLTTVAQASNERLFDSPSPVSSASKEEIERIVDQRVQDILKHGTIPGVPSETAGSSRPLNIREEKSLQEMSQQK